MDFLESNYSNPDEILKIRLVNNKDQSTKSQSSSSGEEIIGGIIGGLIIIVSIIVFFIVKNKTNEQITPSINTTQTIVTQPVPVVEKTVERVRVRYH